MKNILLALLSLFAIQIFAQIDIDVKIGDEFTYEPKFTKQLNESYDWVVFRNSKSEMVGFQWNPNGEIRCTTYKGNMTSNEMHRYIKNDVLDAVKNFIQMDDNLYYFKKEYSKQNNTLTADLIDIRTGQVKENNKSVFSTSECTAFGYTRAGEKLIVFYKYDKLIKNGNDKYAKVGVIVLDKNLKKLSSSEFISTRPDKDTRISRFVVDSKNNAYLINEVIEGKIKKYELDMVASNSTEAKTITLGTSLNQFAVQGLSLCEDKNGDIYLYGYTTGKFSDINYPIDLLLFKINPVTKTAKRITDKPLKPSLISNGTNQELTRFFIHELPPTSPKQIFFLENGSKLLVGSSGITGQENNSTMISYVDSSGNLVWTKNFLTYNLSRFPDNPFFFTKDGFYITYFSTAGKKTLDGVADNQLILAKVTYDGKQQDKVLMGNIDKMTNVLSTADGKTKIIEVCMGLNKENKSVNKFVTLTLK